MSGAAKFHSEALHCVACGGPNPAQVQVAVEGDSGAKVVRVAAKSGDPCRYCGAPLVPVDLPPPAESRRCPNCAHSEAGTAKFCRVCGAAMTRPDPTTTELSCAGCGGHNCHAWSTEADGHGLMVACGDCGGIWISHEAFERLQSDADDHFKAKEVTQAAMGPGGRVSSRSLAHGVAHTAVVYRNCPECGQQMARRNFAQCSGVVLDICPTHGVYCDAGELEAVLAFVRSGGLALAKKRRAAQDARAQQQQGVARSMVPGMHASPYEHNRRGELDELNDAIVGLLDWGARWIRDRVRKK